MTYLAVFACSKTNIRQVFLCSNFYPTKSVSVSKILIIEDELITATAIQETLQNAGHEITALARNLREALSAVKRQLPDLALIDITLEGSAENGIEVAKQLMILHHMPIIYLTAHSEPSMVLNAKETHPAAYLLKPFRHKELAIQVELAYYNYQINQKTTIDPHAAESLYLSVEQGKGHVKIVKVVTEVCCGENTPKKLKSATNRVHGGVVADTN